MRKWYLKRKEKRLFGIKRKIFVETLEDIPDKEVKNLLKRVLRFPFVKKIELVDYHKVGVSQGDTRLEYKTKHEENIPNYVHYEIRCKDGVQDINIWVDKGFCDDLIFMLGRKVHC